MLITRLCVLFATLKDSRIKKWQRLVRYKQKRKKYRDKLY